MPGNYIVKWKMHKFHSSMDLSILFFIFFVSLMNRTTKSRTSIHRFGQTPFHCIARVHSAIKGERELAMNGDYLSTVSISTFGANAKYRDCTFHAVHRLKCRGHWMLNELLRNSISSQHSFYISVTKQTRELCRFDNVFYSLLFYLLLLLLLLLLIP